MRLIDTHETVIVKGEPITTRIQRWDFTEEVARGTQLLNRLIGPDWHNGLELEELDLQSGSNCVLGQLAMTRFRHQLQEYYPDGEDESGPCTCSDCLNEDDGSRRFEYSDVTKMLAVKEDDDGWYRHSTGNPGSHGFYVNEEDQRLMTQGYTEEERDDLQRAAWEHLTWAWMDVIRDRRKEEKKREMAPA